ncbi:hypothetical protein BKA62DRAFT_711232, partial [Auriculariales sp. MPI-PUGE-AT-0066]
MGWRPGCICAVPGACITGDRGCKTPVAQIPEAERKGRSGSHDLKRYRGITYLSSVVQYPDNGVTQAGRDGLEYVIFSVCGSFDSKRRRQLLAHTFKIEGGFLAIVRARLAADRHRRERGTTHRSIEDEWQLCLSALVLVEMCGLFAMLVWSHRR